MGGVSDWQPQTDATEYQVILDYTGYQVCFYGFYCKVEERANTFISDGFLKYIIQPHQLQSLV